MTERSLFNRRYTSFSPNGSQVWLVNGAGVSTSLSSTTNFLAGVDLAQGEVVFASGFYVVPAVAASGVTSSEYQPIGVTAEAAFQNATLSVVLDDSVIIPGSQITADSALVPGEIYYLSRYSGEVTRYSTASGVVTFSGGYSALVALGTAISTSELQVEIQNPIILIA